MCKGHDEYMNAIITLAGLLLGILGLVGTIITVLTYLNPMFRFRWYLRHPSKWETISAEVWGAGEFQRHVNHPEFVIELSEQSKKWDRKEPWVGLHPDPNMSSNMVQLKISGQILSAEEFISLDGRRYFVPVPKVIYKKGGKETDNVYYYTKLQRLVAGVVSVYNHDEGIDQFMSDHGIKKQEDLATT
jgi:hypothetical protein